MKKTQSRFFRALPWLIAAFAYLTTMLLIAAKGRPYLDSDMSSEMVLANLLNQEGGLLSANWWYSTELRVFYLQIFYRLGLLLFPQDWFMARVFGQALWMLALFAAYIYMARGMGLTQSGAWGVAALACPFGAWYFWYGAYSGFYLPNMILILFSLGAVLRLLKPKAGVRRAVQWAILAIVCFAAGLSSMKTLMAMFLPLPVAAAAMAAREFRKNGAFGETKRLLIVSVIASAIAFFGYLINAAVLTKRYSYIGSGVEMFSAFGIDDFLSSISRFFALFGYPADSYWDTNIRVLSIPGVLGAFGILTALAIAVSLVRLLKRADALSVPERLAPVLFLSMILVEGMIFTVTGGWANGAYWLLVVPFAFPVLQLEVETERVRLPQTRKIAVLGLCVCLFATSATSVFILFRRGMRTDERLMAAAEELDARGYTQGYATPWHANAVTEWTSGRVEVWTTIDFSTGEALHWLQSKAHEQPPEGRVFVLATMGELEEAGAAALADSSNRVYTDGEYVILDFENVEAMKRAFSA